jgi:glycosyltransferase involved in cell wall biosynthesis
LQESINHLSCIYPAFTPNLSQIYTAMKVSVIIANYNYDRYLPTAINSVLAQTYSDYEIIVVDDGSIDDSSKILTDFESRLPSTKFKVIYQENQGHGGAINTGFQSATGEIIAFLDSDDVWKQDKLDQIVFAFKRSDVVAVIHPLDIMNAEGVITNSQATKLKIGNDNLAQIILDTGSSWHYPPTSGLAFRHRVLQNVLPMEPPLWRFWPDGCLLYCAAFFGKVVAINQVLGSYRLHGSNTFYSAKAPTRDGKLKAIGGVKVTSQWLNQFLERIDYPRRVDLSRNLDYRRANYYLQGRFNTHEMFSITRLILGWHFYTWSERIYYTFRFWLKSASFLFQHIDNLK